MSESTYPPAMTYEAQAGLQPIVESTWNQRGQPLASIGTVDKTAFGSSEESKLQGRQLLRVESVTGCAQSIASVTEGRHTSRGRDMLLREL